MLNNNMMKLTNHIMFSKKLYTNNVLRVKEKYVACLEIYVCTVHHTLTEDVYHKQQLVPMYF